MSVKQRRLGTGFMPRSVTARVMIVCIWPRKKRTRSGFTAPGWSRISASAAFSCEAMHRQHQHIIVSCLAAACGPGHREVTPCSRIVLRNQCQAESNEHVFTLVPICSMLLRKNTAHAANVVCRLDQHSITPHLCAVDFVVGEVPRELETARLVADEQLPDLLAALVQDRTRAKVQLPCVGCWRAAGASRCLRLSVLCRATYA